MNKRVLLLLAVTFRIIPAIAQEPALQQQQIAIQSLRSGETGKTLSTTLTAPAIVIPVDKPVQKLGDVKKIFVASLGTAEGSELIRQKLMNRLSKSGSVVLVDSADDADATLTGITNINQRNVFVANLGAGSGFASGGTRYSAELVVRLIGKNQQILWTDETASRRFFGGDRSVGSVSSNVTNKLVKSLTEAIAMDKSESISTSESVRF